MRKEPAEHRGWNVYPLGEWHSTSAVSKHNKGWLRPLSSTAFWNVEIAPG